MIDTKEILDALRKMHDDGMTQQEIADRAAMSQTYVADLLSGKRPTGGLSVKMLNKLFPRAVLLLTGDAVSIHANRNSGNVVGVNHGTISQDCLSAVQDKILETEDLTPEEKIKVLKVLKK